MLSPSITAAPARAPAPHSTARRWSRSATTRLERQTGPQVQPQASRSIRDRVRGEVRCFRRKGQTPTCLPWKVQVFILCTKECLGVSTLMGEPLLLESQDLLCSLAFQELALRHRCLSMEYFKSITLVAPLGMGIAMQASLLPGWAAIRCTTTFSRKLASTSLGPM